MRNLIIVILVGVLFVSCNSNAKNNNINVATNIDSVANVNNADTIEPLVLVFDDYINEWYTYKLEFIGEDVKITYTFGNHEPIVEYGRFIDQKIIINGCDTCYDIVNTACDGCRLNWKLYVYNPETDGHDVYNFNEDKSNTVVIALYN